MLPMGMPNRTMHTETRERSGAASRSRGSKSNGMPRSFTAEKMYSRGWVKIFRRSEWARVKPTATRAMGEATLPR